jgi:hypothetical protein
LEHIAAVPKWQGETNREILVFSETYSPFATRNLILHDRMSKNETKSIVTPSLPFELAHEKSGRLPNAFETKPVQKDARKGTLSLRTALIPRVG